ncbi:hypothetical protein BH10PSE17_BH10PSE17_05940 [soil metagenome]
MTPAPMNSTPTTSRVLCFGPFQLDIEQSRLTRDGSPVALRPKAFELLSALARCPQQLVTKEQLLDQVWGRRFITEGVIKSIIGELRTALGDDPREPRWIETVPKRGYRFVGALAQGEPGRMPDPPAPSNPDIGNLPQGAPALIGRDTAMAEALALFDSHRLLTIAGPAGVGKTRLAIALGAARREPFADGVWFVELAPLASLDTDESVLGATLVRLLRLDAAACAQSVGLARALQPLQMVLIFDNAEHLLAPLTPLVETFLAGAPRLKVVVTSQEPLRTAHEQVCRVLPLSLPAAHDDLDPTRLMSSGAVQLFVDRVSSRLPSFVIGGEQRQAVAAICRSLDGMPLALELAAARVPMLGVHGLADLLLGDDTDARLKVLTLGPRTAVARQRTLRSAIEWSHGLLDERQQRLFRRLGVFSGSFSIASAARIGAGDELDEWQVIDILDALVDKSLLEPAPLAGVPRFRLMQSLRAFALEQLREHGEIEAIRNRHLAASIDYWTDADDDVFGTPALEWTDRHLPDVDNLRSALRWAVDDRQVQSLVTLVARSALFWYRAGMGSEGRTWCDTARRMIDDSDVPDLQHALDLCVATLALYLNAYPGADGLAAARRLVDSRAYEHDAVRHYYALHLLYQMSVHAQQTFDRSALIERMAAIERSSWSDVLKRFLRAARAYDRRLAGDADGYLVACRDELRLCQRIGAVAEGWTAAHGLLLAEHDIGNQTAAVATGREAVDAIRAAGRLRQFPTLIALWTTMLAQSGEVQRSRAALVEALPILHGAGTPWKVSLALAWFAAGDQRHEDAARLNGWHQSLLEDASVVGAGGYILRSTGVLTARLVERFGPEVCERLMTEGRTLDWQGAERLALGGSAALA